MNELQLLNATRNDIGTMPDATWLRGRERLMRAAREETTHQDQDHTQPENEFQSQIQLENEFQPRATGAHLVPRKTKTVRYRRGFALAAAAAVFLTGVGVAADVVLPERQPLSAEAAAALDDVAAATIRASDPVVLPGQYLKIDKKALGGSQSVEAGLSWDLIQADQLYIPADRQGEWVWNREQDMPTDSAPESVKEAARLLPTVDPRTYAAMVGVFRMPGGVFGEGEQYTIVGAPLTDTDGLPRDPRELLDRIYEHTKGAGKSPDLQAFKTIVESLRTGVIPADLRAAFYQAAGLIPGVEVMDGEATIDGRTGIAIGKATPNGGSRQDMIIDPTSGLVIGEQIVTLEDYPGSPAGTVESWTSVRTSVVDSAP